MQEVFAKPGFENLPIEAQEFYELRLDYVDDLGRPGFYVRQACARWSKIDRKMMWDIPPRKSFPTIAEAESRYESQRQVLVEMGFSQSDMEI